MNLAQSVGKTELDLTEKQKLEIGEKIIEKIQEQAKDSRDKDGKRWTGRAAKYSPKYKESLAFKAFGKTGKVNMTLSGDMLDLMKVVKKSKNTITIGWKDEGLKLRAQNHINGNTVPKRDFLGLPKKEVAKIVKEEIED